MACNLQKADHKVNGPNPDLQTFFLQNAGMERHQRLKIARERHFRTAKAAAESLGVPYGTYSGHEADSRGIKDEALKLYARRFKVPLEWLSLGIGSVDEEVKSAVRVVGRIGAGAHIDLAVVQPDAEPVTVEVALQMPPGVIAFEVIGGSMYPKYEDGDMIVCEEDGVALEDLPDGVEAAVLTTDGVRALKKLIRTDTPGIYNLESHNAPAIRGVSIEWASDVLAIIPKRKWRRLTPADRKSLVRSTKARR